MMGARNGSHPLHTVRLRHSVLDRTVSNLFHVGELEPGYVRREGLSLAHEFLRWWNNGLLLVDAPARYCGRNANGVDIVSNIASVIEDDPLLSFALGFITSGLSSDDCVSNEATVAIEWTTGYSGRSMHGRTYLVAVPDRAFVTDNRDKLAQPYASDVLFAYKQLLTVIRSIGPRPGALTLALAHHTPQPHGPGPSPWWTPITGARIYNQRAASQRKRRLPYRGPILEV